MKKILTVIGARPQFIKASVVSHAIEQAAGIHEIVVHTGQHFDANMSDVFFAELGMDPPAYHLGIGGSNHGAMTGRMLEEVERILVNEQPDVVLVYGDTNSTLAGALAAVKLHIPVAHVEAGLRSFNMRMPEEVNRVLTDRISTWLFTPTESAVRHLRSEGVSEQGIIPAGDVMYDVALHHGARVGADGGALGSLGLSARGYVLATVHRAENTDDQGCIKAIVDAFQEVSKTMPVVWPIHPRTRNVLREGGYLDALQGQVHVIDPVGYLDMVQLEKYAALIATDSGGVQKEAFFHKVPCVTLREETEWVELVDAGWNRLVPPRNSDEIAISVLNGIGTAGIAVSPYGEGDAALCIVDRLTKELRG